MLLFSTAHSLNDALITRKQNRVEIWRHDGVLRPVRLAVLLEDDRCVRQGLQALGSNGKELVGFEEAANGNAEVAARHLPVVVARVEELELHLRELQCGKGTAR